MKVAIPKHLRGLSCPTLFTIEMNDFDVEMLLPSLFFAVCSRGRGRSRANDGKKIDEFLEKFYNHPHLKGFEGAIGRRVVEKWARTSLMKVGRTGRGRHDEQILYVLPLTFLCYKTGFPSEIRRQRNVHGFLYSVMRQCLTELGCEDPGEELFKIFVENFGRGVEIGPPPQYDGRYDGKTPLDLETLACLYFLEGFAAAAATGKEAPPQSPLLPGVARQMASDLLMFLVCYSSRVPQGRLVRGFLSLITIWLFVYTVKLFHAANFLARRGQLAPAMTDRWRDSPPEIYVDFTGLRESVSDRLARQCVERDLAEMRAYLETALRVRTLERFVTQLPEKEDELAGLSGSERVMKLLEFSADPDVRADARAEIRAIKEETLKALEQEAAKRAAEEFFGDIRRRFDPDSLGELIYLLLQSQGQKGVGNSGRWFWSCAGLNKPYGILSGNLRGRRNWRYAMGNELLAALVYLAAVAQQGPWQLGERREPKPLRILDFLQFLRSRFGILVDRPPEFADSAEARAAATENLMALKRRLRQMGFFEELSDDFTAQHIHVVVETEHEHKSRAHHARML